METETKVDSLDDLDSLSLEDDDMNLDNLSLGDEKVEIKLTKLESKFLNANKATPNIINPIIKYCKDKVKPSGNYVTDIKALFVYLKTNDILVPENLLDSIPF